MDPCFTTDFLPHLPDGEAPQPPHAFTYPFFYTPHPMVVAAAEVVVGLAIIVTIFRTRRSASIDEPNLLKY